MALFGPAATMVSKDGSLGTELAHPLVEVEPDLPLGAAGPDAAGRDQLGQRLVGDRAGLAQRLDLAVVLDRPQGLDQVGGRRQLDRSSRSRPRRPAGRRGRRR